MRLADQFGQPQELFISSGYLEMLPHTATILADTVLRTPEMDEAEPRAAIERTHTALAAHPSAADYDRLKAELIYGTRAIACDQPDSASTKTLTRPDLLRY